MYYFLVLFILLLSGLVETQLQVVKSLTANLKGYFDNYFSSVILAGDLLDDGLYCIATTRSNRNKWPGMVHKQITTHSIALVFNLNPATIWLQECYGHRIYIPDEHGNFEMPRQVYRVTVNGVQQDSPRSNVPTGSGILGTSTTSSGNSITLSATSSPSDHSSASQLNRPFFQSVTSGRSSNYCNCSFCSPCKSVVAPNGLVAHMFGPIEGRRHDTFMLGPSGLSQKLHQFQQPDGQPYLRHIW